MNVNIDGEWIYGINVHVDLMFMLILIFISVNVHVDILSYLIQLLCCDSLQLFDVYRY